MTSDASALPVVPDASALRRSVRDTYAAVARGNTLSCCGPSGATPGAATAVEINMIGDAYDGVDGYVEAADLQLGCGLPVEHAGLAPGQTVLDLGSGASACCTVPLLLVSLGVGGAWVGSLTAFEPYRPAFVALAVGALGYVAWREWGAARSHGRRLRLRRGRGSSRGAPVHPRRRRARSRAASGLAVARPRRERPAGRARLGRTGRHGTRRARRRGHDMRLVRRDRPPGAVERRRRRRGRGLVRTAGAVVSFDPTRATVADLMAATAAAGYPTHPATDA